MIFRFLIVLIIIASYVLNISDDVKIKGKSITDFFPIIKQLPTWVKPTAWLTMIVLNILILILFII